MKPTSTEHWPFSDPRQPRQIQAEKGIRDVGFHRLQLKGSAPALSCAALSSDLASTPLTQQGSHGLISCAARDSVPYGTNVSADSVGRQFGEFGVQGRDSAVREANFTNANDDLWPVNQTVKQWAPYIQQRSCTRRDFKGRTFR